MIDLKKKCWREKVTAEITVAHMLQFARELGSNLSADEIAAFLNEKGRAQDIWTHMMQAAEAYIKSGLAHNKTGIHTVGGSVARKVAAVNHLHPRAVKTPEPTSVSYQ